MKHLSLIILFIALVACKNEDSAFKILKIVNNKTISIPIKDVSYGLLTNPKLVQFNHKNFIIFAADFSYIHFISVENPNIRDKVKVPIGDIIDVEFINSDSILIVYNLHDNFNEKYHLILVDIKGNIKKKVNLNKYNPSHQTYITHAGYSKTLSYQRYWPFRIKGLEDTINSTKKNKYSQIAVYDLINDTVIYNNDLFYPDFPNYLHLKDRPDVIYISTFKNKNPLIRYVYSPYAYEWNLKNNKTIKHFITSQIIDSIYNSNKYLNAVFTEAKYNPYRDHIFFLCLTLLSESDVYKPIIILTDGSYRYITETTEAKYFLNSYFFDKENISITVDGDNIILTYFDYYFEKTDKNKYSSYVSSIKKEIVEKQNEVPNLICQIVNSNKLDTVYDIMLLLKNYFHLNDTNLSLISMYGEMGCASCNESLLEFLSDNYIYFKNNKLYVLLSSTKKFSNYMLEKYKFRNYPYLLLDTLNISTYFNTSKEYIPRLIKIKNKTKYYDRFFKFDAKDSLEMELLKIVKNK